MTRRAVASLLLASAMALVIMFIGCRPHPKSLPNSAPPSATSVTSPSEKPEAKPAPAPPGSPATAAKLVVSFIDVGQGDSILIDLADTEILIDGGEQSPGVTSYIGNYVDGPLEAVVATHPHTDHIGGLIKILKDFDVADIWTNGESSTSKTCSEFVSAAQAEGADLHLARRGDRINVGNLALRVLNPSSLEGTTNNNSIVLSLSYGNVDFLFMGDAEKDAEASMSASSIAPVPDVEILKAGHHASRTASSPDFLHSVSPEVAIYMAGNGNSYGHPHQEILANLCDIGAKVYGSDIHGDIVITTHGKTYQIVTQKAAPPIVDASS